MSKRDCDTLALQIQTLMAGHNVVNGIAALTHCLNLALATASPDLGSMHANINAIPGTMHRDAKEVFDYIKCMRAERGAALPMRNA
ncbi:hypothetical protein [Acetobacter estunensis]|uniref:hypothetical protein n=1 Tax=Acetobacter estunensis TaxID=104097 RepID=UPI001C2D180D|nr:hypothetical protein [Acetobacter estunensis]MBV1835618.1 hypothetical protein [Acetobacter estunensis]MBV1836121.1 hypothetical protein [Acetobacter estunensis]